MVGRLVDTELPDRQRQGEINPDQFQCDFMKWKCFRCLSMMCFGKAINGVKCLESLMRMLQFCTLFEFAKTFI